MKNSTGEAGAPSEKKKTYPYEEVLKEALKYFDGDELAATTWAKKYALKDLDGRLLEKTPADMHHRMAREFARIEKKYPAKDKARLSTYGQTRSEMGEKEIFELFDRFRYIVPQGSVMTALGNKEIIASLSNCVVVPSVIDSYGGIFHTDEQ